jgi:ParB family chromosome partitioning protein
MNIQKIPVDKIKIPEIRASAHLTEEQKAMLEASIANFGIIQPIIVRRLPDGSYELVAGKNRLEASKQQGINIIDAVVIDMDEKTSLMLNMIENLARGETNDIEVAKVIKKAIDMGMGINDIAKMLNRSVQWVKDRLLLLELPEDLQEYVAKGILKIGHIKAAAQLPTPEEIADALKTCINLEWDVKTLERYVENRLEQLRMLEEARAQGVKPPEFATLPKEEIVNLMFCPFCKRYVKNTSMSYMLICEDCKNLLQYVTDNIGTGMEAMKTIYSALTGQQVSLQQEYSTEQSQSTTK